MRRLTTAKDRTKNSASPRDVIRVGSRCAAIEWTEARFVDHVFAPHRHDTYAIGITLEGVQTFRYLGETRHCLPGQCHILHPDELHDGKPGTPEGYRYRIVYVDPCLVQDALGGHALPFVPSPVLSGPIVEDVFASGLWDIDEDIDSLSETDLAVAVTRLLVSAGSGRAPVRQSHVALQAVKRVREWISAAPARPIPMEALEKATDLDRWTIARQFRLLYGISPSRYRTHCQLRRVRRALAEGESLLTASVEAGFADQSHMTRQFKNAFGITPGVWLSATARGPSLRAH